MKKTLPDFSFENEQLDCLVIGVDEVGRGALAGPVVAGATAIITNNPINQLPVEFWLELGIDDSKRLTPKKREELAKIIKENAFWGIGEVSATYINSHGIVKATEKAMRLAIKYLRAKVKEKQCFVLIDAFQLKHVAGVGLKRQKGIIKGDQKSISIAAASIIAKVYRDNLMIRLHKKHPSYGWHNNKGYGTKEHLKSIKDFGAHKIHRKDFLNSA